MSKKNNAHLEQPKLIAGFFREALFFSRNLFIKSEVFTGEAKLLQIEEPSARAKSDERYLIFSPLGDGSHSLLANGSEVNFRCSFPQLIATWQGAIESIGNGTFRTKIPLQVEISNARSSLRIVPNSPGLITTNVLVQTGGIHAEGRFEIENISKRGIGGILTVPAGLSVRSDTRVIGVANLEHGRIQVDGRVSQVTIISEPGNHIQELVCRVGLQRWDNENIIRHEENDSRKHKRFESNFEIELRSPLNPKHVIHVNIVNVSVGGFAAKLSDAGDQHLLPLGVGAILEDSTLVSEVVDFENDVFRFQFIAGSNPDRIRWLRRITLYENERTAVSTGIGHDLINLFCESGALASAFIKIQQKNAADVLFGMAGESGSEPYIHRWIERTTSGEQSGHICAQQWGDNSWFIGDLAGSVDENRRISRTLVPKFFAGFLEHCLSSTPCPKIVMTWNEGHPYWKNYEQYLKNEGKDFILCDIFATYSRFEYTASDVPVQNVSISQIHAHDYKLIRESISAVRKTPDSAEMLLSAFNFDLDTFGSPTLTRLIRTSGKMFSREYVKLQIAEATFLGVLSSFPSGFSPNRTCEVGWIIPLNQVVLSESDASSLRQALKQYSVKRGFSMPGVVWVSDNTEKSKYSENSKRMRWLIVHPMALLFFVRSA